MSYSSIIERIIKLSKDYGANCLIMFGSYTETPNSAGDIDIACDGIKGWKIYEFAGQVENELHIPVDIIPLSPPNDFTRLIETKGKVLYDIRGTA
ncbi:MAG: DNA polymerase III subunit beta [bacterium]|nr:DNA polymerase III subunit beta [bacterium]